MGTFELPDGERILLCDGAVYATVDGPQGPHTVWLKDCTCAHEVTHIDNKGYLYCTRHGESRKSQRPCRKLRPHELNRLKRGEPLKRY